MKWLSLLFLFMSTATWAQGSFRLYKKSVSYPGLNYARDIYVYLPAGYAKSKSTYPVLYMHDGQNLFDPSRAYLGRTWKAESTLNDLMAKKLMRPIIVVAIDNTPERMDEYIPEKNGDQYLNFLANSLKPEIDKNFRTNSNPENTGIMGSSLGGLISLYGGLRYSRTFKLVGALSPSIWWNDRSIINRYQEASETPLKIYLDSGTLGGEKPQDVVDLMHVLEARGYRHAENLCVYIQDGADHQEDFWAQRLPVALKFLFPLP